MSSRRIGALLLILAVLLLPMTAFAQPQPPAVSLGPVWVMLTDGLLHKGAHITTATTTTILAGVTGQKIYIYGAYVYCDAGGVATTVTVQDSAATNLAPGAQTFALATPGWFSLPLRANPWWNPTGSGNGLQVVTSAAGPCEAYFEVVQQ